MRVSVAALLATALVLASAPARAADDALAPILITTDEAPPGWSLTDERRADDVDAVPEARAAVQQRWSYRGEDFAIVYFLCGDAADAEGLYERHASTLGAGAVVVPLGPVVVELHDAPNEVWAEAGVLLGFDEAQQHKLVAAALPRGWKLEQEFLAPLNTVAQAREAIGSPIQSVLVQGVRSPLGTVRMNYFLCADARSAMRVYENATARTRPNAFVTLDGPLVIELLAEDRSMLLPALEILEAAPLRSRADRP